jgi:hypothetical protein
MASIVLGSTTVISESSGVVSIADEVMPAGSVIQCHHIIDNTRTSYSSPTTGDGTRISEIDLPITLKSTNSKIICQWMLNGEIQNDNVFEIYKDSSLATNGRNTNSTGRWSGFVAAFFDTDWSSTPFNFNILYIDPNPTSATYNVRVSATGGTASTFYLNRTQGSAGADSYENMVSTGIIWEIMK